MTIGTRSRAGSLDTTHTEPELEQEHEYGSLFFEKSDNDHDYMSAPAPTCERQKSAELAAESMWVGIATLKNDVVTSTSTTIHREVVEME